MDKLSLFLSDFVDRLSADCGDKIDYILLSGSAARGDFREGASDIDLIVKTKGNEHVGRVREKAESVFWELDSKYGMDQRASLKRKPDERLISFGRPAMRPVLVHGGISKRTIRSYFNLYNKALLRYATKPHLRLLYGRRGPPLGLVYDDPFSLFVTYDLVTASLALLLFPLSPERSLVRSIRSVMFTMEPYLSQDSWQGRVGREAGRGKSDLSAICRDWPLHRKALYCAGAPFLIAANNVSEIIYRLRTGRLPEEG